MDYLRKNLPSGYTVEMVETNDPHAMVSQVKHTEIQQLTANPLSTLMPRSFHSNAASSYTTLKE